MVVTKGVEAMLLREVLGATLRSQRRQQRRTLREISARSSVSLGYLSEIERGQKEASSELLAAICDALGIALAQLLRNVSDQLDTRALATVTAMPTRGIAPTQSRGMDPRAHAA